jgi:hypothetical protein
MERINTTAAQKAKKIIVNNKKEKQDKEDMESASQFLRFLSTLTIYPFAIKLLWNWLMPTLFGLPPITFLQSLGLLIMSRIIIKYE